MDTITQRNIKNGNKKMWAKIKFKYTLSKTNSKILVKQLKIIKRIIKKNKKTFHRHKEMFSIKICYRKILAKHKESFYSKKE